MGRTSIPAACCLACLIAGTGISQENLALNTVVVKNATIPVIREENESEPIDATGKIINSDRPVIEVICVGNTPVASDYEYNKDFDTHNGWRIRWLAGGRHPRPGSTYYVSCKYVSSEKGHNTSSHGIHLTDGTRKGWRDKAPTWIYVDLHEEKTIGRVVVRQNGTNYLSAKIAIQFAKSGAKELETDSVWRNVMTTNGKNNNPLENAADIVNDFTIHPVKSRYFRLVIEKGCPANNFAYITELELYAPQ